MHGNFLNSPVMLMALPVPFLYPSARQQQINVSKQGHLRIGELEECWLTGVLRSQGL